MRSFLWVYNESLPKLVCVTIHSFRVYENKVRVDAGRTAQQKPREYLLRLQLLNNVAFRNLQTGFNFSLAAGKQAASKFT